MRKTKQFLLMAAMLLCSVGARAAYEKINGVWINITSEANLTAEVVYDPYGYSGNVIIPETIVRLGKTYRVTAIASSAFDGDIDVTSVFIPESVTSIGPYAFRNCSGMKNINFPKNCRADLDAFLDCTGELTLSRNLPLVQVGHPVKYYGYFYGSKFTSVVIEEGVTSVGPYAFWNCTTITTVNIPKSVTAINDMAFFGCNNLTDLTLHSNPLISAGSIPSTTRVNLVLNDDEAADFNVANANTYDRVVYNRELGAGKYGTIMLPFAPDAESMENFAFYSLSSVDGETLIFDEVATPLANTPYLYALREGESATQITGGETTIASVIATPEIDGWKTVGSFINQTVDCSAGDACYYAINAADNMLYNVVSKMHVKPSRAYFKSSANVSQLCIRTRDGGETLIDAVKVADFTPTVYYDLSGRRVENPTEGIYIVNGKKVVL